MCDLFYYTPKFNIAAEGNFAEAMLNFQGVLLSNICVQPMQTVNDTFVS